MTSRQVSRPSTSQLHKQGKRTPWNIAHQQAWNWEAAYKYWHGFWFSFLFSFFKFKSGQWIVHVHTHQQLNSFVQGIQFTWLNIVVMRSSGQDSEFASEKSCSTSLPRREQQASWCLNVPASARVPGCSSWQEASDSWYQDPDLTAYRLLSSCLSWKCKGVTQSGESTSGQLPSLQSVQCSQQETWVSGKADQNWRTSETVLRFILLIFSCGREAF